VNGFAKFLALFPDAPVKTLQDVTDFNIANKELELPDRKYLVNQLSTLHTNASTDHPGQELLIGATKNNMTDEDFEKSLKIVRQQARDGIDKVLAEHGIDVIMGPADARIASVAAAAGYPVATAPLGYADFNGRAFGMNIIDSGGKEDKILAIMRAWEASFPEARKPPPMLVDWDTHNGAHV
jgi:amidase